MIALLCTALAFGAEFGASLGGVFAEQTAGSGIETAGAASIYSALGVSWIRGEAHLGYTGLGGKGGNDAVEVTSRSGDLRAYIGVSIPLLDLPRFDIGGDVLLGPDIRLTSVRTEILGIRTSSAALSVHPSVALGPFAEIGIARLGVRLWADLPREGRVGFSAMGGVRF